LFTHSSWAYGLINFMSTKPLVIGLLIVLIGAGGWLTYEYVKRTPPDFLIKLFTATAPPPPLPQGDAAPFEVPEGFKATIYAREIKGARVMIRDPKGALLASLTQEGKIVALPDLDTNGEADDVITVLEGLNLPHGMLFVCPDTGNTSADQDACTLYVAETNAVKSYSYDPDTYRAELGETLIELPFGRGHYTRTLLMHPDGERLLISVGSSCNVCNEEDAYRASVVAVDLETKEASVFASGLRNTVFMAVHPETEEIWGTDNGRDLLGDDIPPDELNIIREGADYGWPLCYGNQVHDADFDPVGENRCENTVASHIELQAHAAALGLAFIPETGWPEAMRGDVLVALHGSWNRSEPSGYKVVRVPLDENGSQEGPPEDFMTGFLPEGSRDTDDALGRPVGLLAEESRLFVSDDRAGAIYLVAVSR
jgi:glucose/arabinose dehydrogenase